MSADYFLDTNLFVYTFDLGSPEKSSRARELIQEALRTGAGIISYQVVQEFFAVALRKFASPMTAPEAETYLAAVLRPLLAVHSSEALYVEAFQLLGRLKISWYDSLIIAAALSAGCRILYTEDMQHGLRVGDLQVINPFL